MAEGGSISLSMAPSHKGKTIGSYSIAFKLDAVKYHLDWHTKLDTARYCFMLSPPPPLPPFYIRNTRHIVRYFPILSCICSLANDMVEYPIHSGIW